jgi:hypothetical protein
VLRLLKAKETDEVGLVGRPTGVPVLILGGRFKHKME